MEKQILKTGDRSFAIQSRGNVSIKNGLSYSEVRQIFYDLFEGNFPKLVQAAAEQAKYNLEDFLNSFESKINEDERQKIQNSLKKPNSQYLLNTTIEQAARFGKTINLNLLSEALKQALLVDDNDLTSIFSMTLQIIPQLSKNQLLAILVSFYLHSLGFQIEEPIIIEAMTKNCFNNYLNLGDVTVKQVSHLVSLGIYGYNPFAGDKGISFIQRRYSKNSKIIESLNNGQLNTIKFIIDYYDRNKLVNYHPLPVADAIAYLLIRENIPQLNIDILK